MTKEEEHRGVHTAIDYNAKPSIVVVREDRFHLVGRLALKGREDVAVCVDRQADLTVTSSLHDYSRMKALHE